MTKPIHHWVERLGSNRGDRTLCGRPVTEAMSWSVWDQHGGSGHSWASSSLRVRRCRACERSAERMRKGVDDA